MKRNRHFPQACPAAWRDFDMLIEQRINQSLSKTSEVHGLLLEITPPPPPMKSQDHGGYITI